jgi:hypothetical protein
MKQPTSASNPPQSPRGTGEKTMFVVVYILFDVDGPGKKAHVSGPFPTYEAADKWWNYGHPLNEDEKLRIERCWITEVRAPF